MKVPAADIRLAGGLVCPSDAVDRAVWQEHVVKHVLGVHAVARSHGRDPWTYEGWTQLDPPTVTELERADLADQIASLAEGKLRCGVPELRGKQKGSNADSLACRDCQAPIIVRCEKLINVPGGVGDRYRNVTDTLLGALSEETGLQIPRPDLLRALHRHWQAPERLDGAVVLTVGVEDRKGTWPIARINRSDGVRAEFYLEQPNRLRWRTTYREMEATRTGPQKISFLSDVARPGPRPTVLSELCVVARHWWEAHGN